MCTDKVAISLVNSFKKLKVKNNVGDALIKLEKYKFDSKAYYERKKIKIYERKISPKFLQLEKKYNYFYNEKKYKSIFTDNYSNKQSLVYIVQNPLINNYYKIGSTDNLEDRIRTFNTSSPEDFLIINCRPTTTRTIAYKLEKYLHNCFQHKNYKREWFQFNDDELNKVIKILWRYKKI